MKDALRAFLFFLTVLLTASSSLSADAKGAWDLEFAGLLAEGTLTVRAVEDVPFEVKIEQGECVYMAKGILKKDPKGVLVDFAIEVLSGKSQGKVATRIMLRPDAPAETVAEMNGGELMMRVLTPTAPPKDR